MIHNQSSIIENPNYALESSNVSTPKGLLPLLIFLSTLLCSPVLSIAGDLQYIRQTDHVTKSGAIVADLNDIYFTYLCLPGKPLCGGFFTDLKVKQYHPKLPKTVKVLDVTARPSASDGWSHINSVPHNQAGFCQLYSFDEEEAFMGNSIHNVGGTWFPTDATNASAAYRVQGVPYGGIVAETTDGVYGINNDGNITRRYWDGGGWATDIINSWGAPPVVGSLIKSSSGSAYGVNADGRVFTTWDDAGTISYALIAGTSDVLPDSLVWSNGNGLFAVTEAGSLVRIYWAGGSWNIQTIPHSGGDLIGRSLIAGSGTGVHANIYGVNSDGEIFTTYNHTGTILFALVPGTSNLDPDSLAMTDGNGVFGVTEAGEFMRAYWSGGWMTQVIPHWGPDLVPGSLITGSGTGLHTNVYGVNADGQIFLTYNSGGVITFALLPGHHDVSPRSLVMSDGNGVFGIKTTGELVRAYWSGGMLYETITHWGPDLVPESLIAGKGTGIHANVYGVNKNNELFTTYNHTGTLHFAIVP